LVDSARWMPGSGKTTVEAVLTAHKSGRVSELPIFASFLDAVRLYG